PERRAVIHHIGQRCSWSPSSPAGRRWHRSLRMIDDSDSESEEQPRGAESLVEAAQNPALRTVLSTGDVTDPGGAATLTSGSERVFAPAVEPRNSSNGRSAVEFGG